MRPPPVLLEQLTTTRLMPAHAQPSVGTGERRSRRKGPGMEFIDHRPYQAGDDTRHLDPHLFARTGDYVMREYALNQQLPVTILIDLSASMLTGTPDKQSQARLLAQVLGFAAMVGGDRVQVMVPAEKGLRPSPRWQGTARADYLFDWIASQPAKGRLRFSDALALIREELPPRGLVIAISDWWDEDVKPALDMLSVAGQEVLALQVLAPEEMDPERLEGGVVIMEDSETEEEARLVLDQDTVQQYRVLLARHLQELREMFSARQWHFLTVSSEEDIVEICMRRFRGAGVLL